MTNNPTVFVGLSGGVDSSVAAKRLIREGYTVVGVFIKVWQPDFLVCNWEAERLDAMRVAAHLGIPFLTCDGEATYRDEVAKHFIAGYAAGLTPNPDILCNQYVKFGVFREFAIAHGADYIATGHYARRVIHDDGTPALVRGNDPLKDQSYFLWALSPEQLAVSLFPVGDSPKTEIRSEATAAGLPVATKQDSQGVCFLGHINIGEFLSHYLTLTPGPVCTKDGTVVGEHQGAFIYTIGQRHGFTIHTKDADRAPYYVVAKDITTNTLTVDTEKAVSAPQATWQLAQVIIRHQVPTHCLAQIRYRQTPFAVQLKNYDPIAHTIAVIPEQPTEKPALGQSCVLYDGQTCLGGGTIATC